MYNFLPKFLYFKLYRLNLRNFKLEICSKKKSIKRLEALTKQLKNKCRDRFSFLNYHCNKCLINKNVTKK